MVNGKKLVKVSVGFALGIVGLSLVALGSFLGNTWLLRIGIVITTIAVWFISWS